MKKQNNLKSFLLIFILFFSFLTISVKADLLPPPPVELLTTPLTLELFIGNLIINFTLFIFAYMIFVEPDIKKINRKLFFIALVLITLTGFFSDSITFYFIGTTNFLIAALSLGFLIFVLDSIIFKYCLMIKFKKSVKLGIFMAVLTNPFIYLILAAIASIFLYPFVI